MGFADVFDLLGGIGVDRDTISRISMMLEDNRDLLDGSRPSNQTEGAFGQSPAGQDLDAQTLTAHQHVVEALEEMMAGLKGYASNVERFGNDIFGLDEEVQSALMRGTREAETYSAGDNFHDNGIAPPDPAQDGGDRGGDR
jgi:hypothetical protein